MIHQESDFITDLKGNEFLKSVVKNKNFSEVNINDFYYEKLWDNNYRFKKFPIGSLSFESAEIYVLQEYIRITLISKNEKFIMNVDENLGDGPTFDKEPYIRGDKSIRETRTKLGKVNIWNKTARISYLLSPLYGIAIVISFLN